MHVITSSSAVTNQMARTEISDPRAGRELVDFDSKLDRRVRSYNLQDCAVLQRLTLVSEAYLPCGLAWSLASIPSRVTFPVDCAFSNIP